MLPPSALATLLCLAGILAPISGPADDPVDRTIVLIVWDDVSGSEIERLRTKYPGALPHLDSLQAQGTTFRRFYTHPWCKPTRRSLHLSEWCGPVVGRTCTESTPFLDPSTPMLGKSFDAAGYSTAFFGKWHLGSNSFSPVQPPPTGFFVVTAPLFGWNTWSAGIPDDSTACIGILGLGVGSGNYTRWVRVEDAQITLETDHQTQVTVDEVLAWDQATRTEPQRLAVVNFQAAHSPFEIPPASLLPAGYVAPANPTDREEFEAMVLSLDVALGQLRAGLPPDTWWIVISDNGTPEQTTAPDQDPTKVKTSLYEEGIRSVCVMSGPGLPPRIDDSVVSVVDLFPTMLASTGIDVPACLEGQDLGAVLSGGPGARRGYAYAQLDGTGTRSAVVTERWKLIRDSQQGFPSGNEALFDLASDPKEITPLDPSSYAITKPLRRILDQRGHL